MLVVFGPADRPDHDQLNIVLIFVGSSSKKKKISQLSQDHFCPHLYNYVNVLLLEAKHF